MLKNYLPEQHTQIIGFGQSGMSNGIVLHGVGPAFKLLKVS